GALAPCAARPLATPQVGVPRVPPPPPPGFPELPQPPLVTDLAQRPVAPMPAPRMLACNPVGTVFGVASELVECGRARYQKGELDAARTALDSAARGTSDRALQREARYWLAQTLLRQNNPAEAQRMLLLVTQAAPRRALAPL